MKTHARSYRGFAVLGHPALVAFAAALVASAAFSAAVRDRGRQTGRPGDVARAAPRDESRRSATAAPAVRPLSGPRQFTLDDPSPIPLPPSPARRWNEQLLSAIRIDIPKPPVHARNLFHLSVAMWDSWAAYSPTAIGYIVTEKHTATDVEAARAEAISYAAYRVLKHRFPVGYFDVDERPCHPNAATSQTAFDAQMDALGYDRNFNSTEGDSPAALGNRIGAAVIAYGLTDGANEGAGACYPDDTGYTAVNPPLIFKLAGAGAVVDPNRWQPLAFDFFVTQNGIPIGTLIQRFIGVGWGDVIPFALTPADRSPETDLYFDPGPPPLLGAIGDETVKAAMVQNILSSSQVEPLEMAMVDISPGAHLNNPVGTDNGTGHPLNPVTGQPYAPNVVNRADYVRVVAEFWSDGPHSETPPGHWNVLVNYAADQMAVKRIGGENGPIVSDLEWDVKAYLALNGAVHDAAIWAWGTKQYYDSSRPITLIRTMAGLGQSTNPSGPSYHANGLPLVPGLVEVITAQTTTPAGHHAHLRGFEGKIAIRAWLGTPPFPQQQTGGVDWVLAEKWMPYMLKTFVTPPFPGYPSGHSTFSRSAAEVLTALTGSAFFPGGMGSFTAQQNAYLTFEMGPSQTTVLQWATYYDAADQAGLSRRFGGIHPFYDDYPGRVGGQTIGRNAWARAQHFFGPSGGGDDDDDDHGDDHDDDHGDDHGDDDHGTTTMTM